MGAASQQPRDAEATEELRAAAWNDLRAAAADRRSGSARVARAAADAFARLGDTHASVERIEEGVGVLVRGQPVMAASLRLADEVLRASGDGPRSAGEAARRFLDALDAEGRGLTSGLRTFLPSGGTVVTVSASSAVLEGLQAARRLRSRVLCAVSEPGGEGRAAADELREAGIDASVVPDAAVATLASDADVLVFGADALGPKALLNKTGTLAAALSFRHARRPRVAVIGTSKLLGPRGWDAVERAAAARTPAVRGGIRVPVFEAVPLRLVSHLVTEDGPLAPASVAKLARSSELHAKILELLDGG